MASLEFYLIGLAVFFFLIGAADLAIILVALAVVLVLYSIVKKLFEGSMEDVEKAEPEVDSSFVTDWATEIGKKTGDEIAGGYDQGYKHTSKGIWGRIGQGSKNLIEGFNKIFK